MVMVTGDKEPGMSSSGQGSDQLEMSGHMMSPVTRDPVLSHGAVSSLINTQLCHLQSLITVIPLSQAQEKHEKLREPLLTSYTIYDE